MYRFIAELRPQCGICENVAGHVELGLDAVFTDLESAGYADHGAYRPAGGLLVRPILQMNRRVRPADQRPEWVVQLRGMNESREEPKVDMTIRNDVLFDSRPRYSAPTTVRRPLAIETRAGRRTADSIPGVGSKRHMSSHQSVQKNLSRQLDVGFTRLFTSS